jgi:predicted Zn-dependent protease
MKKIKFCLVASALLVGIASCKKNQQVAGLAQEKQKVPQDVLASISKLGFSTDRVIAKEGGYLVEGDIFLTKENLGQQSQSPNLRIADVEQYRTTNVVKVPRVVTVSVSNLTDPYSVATDSAIARYNALNLKLKFRRVDSGGDIDIVGFDEPADGDGYITLGFSGFPTANGAAFKHIQMNTNQDAYGPNPDILYLTTVVTHEMGHCIGFRHTDYMNRAYSCGGSRVNEGAADVGAIRIPGTPSKIDANSWMLACSNGGNRVFNANDIIALKYLYKR